MVNQQPQHVKCTSSRGITEAKQRCEWLVPGPGWVTIWAFPGAHSEG
jgi:hypothetical protein